MVVYIGTLISEGYLVGDSDNNEILRNPVTSENINSKRVCVRFDSENPSTRRIVTYVENEYDLYSILDSENKAEVITEYSRY